MPSNFFYIPMTQRETALGWCWFFLQALVLPVLVSVIPGLSPAISNFLFYVINFATVLILFHRFLRESAWDLPGRIGGILWKAALALVLNIVATTVMNDLIWFYMPQYYIYTDMGPAFYNINDQIIAQMVQEHYVLMAIGSIVLVPVAEELLHRGVIFGSLWTKSPVIACIVSVLVFCAVHVIGYIGHINDSIYLVLSFVQYIPSSLFLIWLYVSTDSIYAPILMHMAYNAIGILSLR